MFISHISTLRIAKTMENGKNYFVLLILTDGIITDMPQTTEAIVNVSSFLFNSSYITLFIYLHLLTSLSAEHMYKSRLHIINFI